MQRPNVRMGRAIALCLAFAMVLWVPVTASAHTEDDPYVTDLIAGGGNPKGALDVGDVLVWNDGDTLYVRYLLDEGCWRLAETHLEVATSLGNIPQRKGNPPPGRFTWSEPAGMSGQQTYEIPLGSWAPGTKLYIAAHASIVCRHDCRYDSETAWAAGEDFPGKNWAMYFTYSVQNPYGSIGDFAWDDLDRDGIQDAGEPGLENVDVNLYDDGMSLLASTMTGASGFYLFSNLAPGTYYVEVLAPEGYYLSPSDQGADDTIDSDFAPGGLSPPIVLGAAEDDLTVDAGFSPIPTGSIGDFIWEDLDGDGIQDSGEPGYSGATVNLYDDQGNLLAMTTTGTDGFYEFSGLEAGTYEVEVELPGGGALYSPSNQGADDTIDSDVDSAGFTGPIVLSEGEADDTVDAGISTPPSASIGDFVWEDLDGDGVQDAGEPGLAGVGVDLFTSAMVPIASATTDANGFYEFTGLSEGGYRIAVSAPTAHVFTPSNQGGDDAIDSDVDSLGLTGPISLLAGEVNRTIDAGLVQLN